MTQRVDLIAFLIKLYFHPFLCIDDTVLLFCFIAFNVLFYYDAFRFDVFKSWTSVETSSDDCEHRLIIFPFSFYVKSFSCVSITFFPPS